MKKITCFMLIVAVTFITVACGGEKLLLLVESEYENLYEFTAPEDMFGVYVECKFIHEQEDIWHPVADNDVFTPDETKVLKQGEKLRFWIRSKSNYSHIKITYMPLKNAKVSGVIETQVFEL